MLQEAKIPAPKFRSSALTLGAFDPAGHAPIADAIAAEVLSPRTSAAAAASFALTARPSVARPAPALGPEGVLESPPRSGEV